MVLAVGLRAVAEVAVVELEVIGALTVVRLVVGTVLLIGAVTASLSLPFPTTAVLLLLEVLSCGSGSDTFSILSISLAKISSPFPASTSAFFPLAAVALVAILVVRGVATSSARDAERVARWVGISSALISLCLIS